MSRDSRKETASADQIMENEFSAKVKRNRLSTQNENEFVSTSSKSQTVSRTQKSQPVATKEKTEPEYTPSFIHLVGYVDNILRWNQILKDSKILVVYNALGANLRGMKYLCCILGLAMLFLTPVITYTCRISQFVCRNNKCVSPDKYCDGVDDCGDMSDEPRFCTVCNRTYYGDVRSTYYITLQKPVERKLPFLCHLTFTANGHEFGDIVQLGFENFHVGRLETQTAEGCPDGYMQILELGRPFTGGSWCGKSNGLALYFSESSTVTLTIRLFYTGRFAGTAFEFRLRYKFVSREEASARFGSATAPIERGEIIPGTYCSRNFYECYRKKCQVQSPNYPGLYPRNVTCLYQIRQKTVPKCKHGMILVQQTNRHKMRLKRSAAPVAGSSASAASAGEDGELGNRTESALRVWDSCDGHRDRIIFYDGLTTEDAVLFVFCGGEWLPPVLSRGPQMLVAFYTSANNVPLQTKESFSLLKGFELDADTVFTDSDSYDFSRHRTSCDFLVNATESETETGVAVKSKNRSGSISSPRHTLPPNTTCTYRFQGRADDHVWLSIASYWHEALRSGAASDSCPTRLRIWDGGGQMLGDHCSRPKICDHSALRNHSRWTRPCGADESYVSPSSSAVMQYFSRPGTAVHPSRFLVHYEFVDTSLGGRAWAGGDADERARFGACSRLFRGAQGGAVRSPRNVFMFARGGAARLACLYRIEADAGERISLTLYNVSFGSANAGAAPGCRSAVDAYIGDQYTCAAPPRRAAEGNATGGGGRQSRLEIAELPWRDVKLQRSCFCDNATLALAAGGAGGYVLESVARVVELRFHVYFANAGDDFHDVYFRARFRMLRRADCPRRQRVRGSGGEIQMTFPAHKRTDSLCEGLPWMVEARDNHSLFVLTWGHVLPLKPAADEQIRCHTRNRILLYSGSPLRLFHVICPGTPNDSQQEIHIFSEEWHTRARGDRAMPNKPPSFLLRFVGKEPGSALLNWMEISRARTPLHLRLEPALNLTLPPASASPSAASPAANRSTSPAIHFDCPFHCPELNACIDASLWCDGHRNCPSGYDELASHCDLKYKVMRNYFILSTILAVILILTVFVLVATVRRFQYSDGGHYADEATGPRRITTEETLYDQSSSTISS